MQGIGFDPRHRPKKVVLSLLLLWPLALVKSLLEDDRLVKICGGSQSPSLCLGRPGLTTACLGSYLLQNGHTNKGSSHTFVSKVGLGWVGPVMEELRQEPYRQ